LGTVRCPPFPKAAPEIPRGNATVAGRGFAPRAATTRLPSASPASRAWR
jgi:hypothetical protein